MNQESWNVIADGKHNAFTDFLFWNENYWLIYVSSPSHFGNKKSCLVLLRSNDAVSWMKIRSFDGEGEDIRDPKLAIIKNKLCVFALLNKRFDPEPYKTIVARSDDGETWTSFEEINPRGWLVGHPITQDGVDWYAPAHRIDQGKAVLLKSSDGVRWSICSTVFEGKEERADETAIHFLKNGYLVAVTRLEAGSSLFGSEHAVTLISLSKPPYKWWVGCARSELTRLDGPVLFNTAALQGTEINDQIFAVGRRQTRVRAPFEKQGSAFGRKRTALFRVNLPSGYPDRPDIVAEDEEFKSLGLSHLCDLPSSGDTSYAGVVVTSKKILISYYTNDPNTDYPWIFGMLRPTCIRIASIDVENIKIFEDKK